MANGINSDMELCRMFGFRMQEITIKKTSIMRISGGNGLMTNIDFDCKTLNLSPIKNVAIAYEVVASDIGRSD